MKLHNVLYLISVVFTAAGIVAEVKDYQRWKATEDQLWRAAAEADATGKLPEDLARDVPNANPSE